MTSRTPWGFRDFLPEEAQRREDISDAIAEAMKRWGYQPVETPVVEFAGNFQSTQSGGQQGFKLFDSDGDILALRPDMTQPLARVIENRMKDYPRPLRLRYKGPVFRTQNTLSGQPREFTQLGIELVGVEGSQADAEVLGVLLDSLEACGLEDARVSVGTVAALQAVLKEVNLDAEWEQAVLSAIHQDDRVWFKELLEDERVDEEAAQVLRDLLRLRGGLDTIQKCRNLLAGADAERALDDLEETISLLGEKYNVDERVRIDFSLLRSFDYYTGIVFEAFSPDGRRSLGGGGSYDEAFATQGRSEAAAGFGLSLDAIARSIARKNTNVEAGVSVSGETAPRLRIAVPKGSLYPGSLNALEMAGFDVSKLRDPGRHLMFSTEQADFYIVRPTDAPVYVASGGADVAMVGKDTLIEAQLSVVELVDLDYGGCRFVVAEPAGDTERIEALYQSRGFLRVGTKYPRITAAYYADQGVQVELIKLHGNVELGALTGMVDRIVDITATGRTLRENNLVVVDEVLSSTARFIANSASLRSDPRISRMAEALEQAAAQGILEEEL